MMKYIECPICGKTADHLEGNEYICEYCFEKFKDDSHCQVCQSENIIQDWHKEKCLDCKAIWTL